MRGYKEEGTTTTPFDMVMLNDLDRYHLVMDVIDRVPRLGCTRRISARRWSTGDSKHAPGRASTATTIPTCATGRGPSEGSRAILVVNAGSTSMKLHLVEDDDTPEVAGPDSLDGLADSTPSATAIVHGGPRFREPSSWTRCRGGAPQRVPDCTSPQHARDCRAGGSRAVLLPGVPHVAVFDTAFHATLPDEASTYAVPSEWRNDWGVRRYGFHGLSVQWASGQVRVPRLVVCHLGGGCSITAVLNGRSVDTTMGFSPLEGVPMTTRSGSVDPGVLLYVLREKGLTPYELDDELVAPIGPRGALGTLRRRP